MQFPEEVLESFSIGQQVSIDGVTVFPILRTAQSEDVLTDIDQAISEDWLDVTEVSESGNVPELEVKNRSEKAVIIFDGEELLGAKQNRIVNVTIIVAGYAKLIIPVSCVEQGRWSWHSRRFASGDFAYPSLRREKFRTVSKSLRRGLGHRAAQGLIWEHIAAKSVRMGVTSDTGAMRDLNEKHRLDDESLRDKIPHQDKQVGYLAYVRSGFAGGDIFPSEAISRRKFYKLLRSYHLDSLDPDTEFPELPADEILNQISMSNAEKVKSVGAGEDLRFEGTSVQGSVTFWEKGFAHLTVFPRLQARDERSQRRGYRDD